jgi:Ser/Thr protein kinase RdoA (MazF antagonist)
VLADGRRVFAKAISAERNPRSPGLYRREIEIMKALPALAPAPRLRWSYDDGDWVMLVLDDVDGAMPAIPWRRGELSRVMSALERLAAALTPAPAGVTPIAQDLAENFRSWRALARDPVLAARLGGWERDCLAGLAGLESSWADAARGGTMLHADLRADNLLLTADGDVMVIDWPYAVTGAAWVDALLFLVSAAADGADPAFAWARYAPGRQADADAVNAVLAAVAGDFVYQSLLPAPQNLPSLRGHQRRVRDLACFARWMRWRS